MTADMWNPCTDAASMWRQCLCCWSPIAKGLGVHHCKASLGGHQVRFEPHVLGASHPNDLAYAHTLFDIHEKASVNWDSRACDA